MYEVCGWKQRGQDEARKGGKSQIKEGNMKFEFSMQAMGRQQSWDYLIY